MVSHRCEFIFGTSTSVMNAIFCHIIHIMKTYFEQTNSHDLPKPKIKKTLKIRGSEETQLFWTSNDGTEEYHPSAEIVNPDEYRGVDSNCNTKKARGSRLMRYSAGIFLGQWNSYLNS